MNHNWKNIALVTFFVVFVSPLVHAKQRIVVRVDGLSCAYCAYGLEKKLKELEGVEKVEINIKEGTASLVVQEGKTINDETINETVKDSGFTPREIKREIEKQKETSNLETIKLHVTGMSCSGCVYNVRTALEKIRSVSEVHVDLQSSTAVVRSEKGKVTPAQLIDAVEKAGRYKATAAQQ